MHIHVYFYNENNPEGPGRFVIEPADNDTDSNLHIYKINNMKRINEAIENQILFLISATSRYEFYFSFELTNYGKNLNFKIIFYVKKP